MSTKPALILIFAISFAFFILLPPFLGLPFPFYESIHWADVLDLLTPLVLIPLYWLLFTDSGQAQRNLQAVITFMVFAALWAQGQGMHLSANSINNLIGEGTSEVHVLIHFYDEDLSHYLWHIGIVGLSVVIIAVQAKVSAKATPVRWAIVIPSAVLYGFTYFAAINEGGTVAFGLPATVLLLVAVLIARLRDLRYQNILAFFFVAYLLALLLFAGWCGYWGRCIEFSEAGFF